jgi:hypothetical protein
MSTHPRKRVSIRQPAHVAAAVPWAVAALLVIRGFANGDPLLWVAGAGAILLALLLPFYTWVSGIEMPSGLATGILVFSLCAFVGGEHWGAYTSIGWWDVVLHLVSAAVLALVGVALVLLNTAGAPPRTGLWIGGILAVGFATLVGAAWELMEFSVDAIFGTNTQRSGLPDTMGDVATNVAGAIYGAVAAWLVLRRGVRLPLAGLLVDFCGRNPMIYSSWPGVPFPAASQRRPAAAETSLMETT